MSMTPLEASLIQLAVDKARAEIKEEIIAKLQTMKFTGPWSKPETIDRVNGTINQAIEYIKGL